MGNSMKSVDVSVGKKISEIRLQRSVSAGEAANKLGISSETYLQLESGLARFRADQLRVLSALLNVRTSGFFEEIFARAQAQKSSINEIEIESESRMATFQ